jgi:hypothetical protein
MDVDNISFFSENNDFQFYEEDEANVDDQRDKYSDLKLQLSFWNPHVMDLGKLYGVLKVYVQDHLPEGTIEMRYRMVEASRRGPLAKGGSTHPKGSNRQIGVSLRPGRPQMKSNRTYREVFERKGSSGRTHPVLQQNLGPLKVRSQTVHMHSNALNMSGEQAKSDSNKDEASSGSFKSQPRDSGDKITLLKVGQNEFSFPNKISKGTRASRFKSNQSPSVEAEEKSLISIEEDRGGTVHRPGLATSRRRPGQTHSLHPTQPISKKQIGSVAYNEAIASHEPMTNTGFLKQAVQTLPVPPQQGSHPGSLSVGQSPRDFHGNSGGGPTGGHSDNAHMAAASPSDPRVRTEDFRTTVLLEKKKEVFRLKSVVEKSALLLLPFCIRLKSPADPDSKAPQDGRLLYTTNDLFIFESEVEMDTTLGRVPDSFELQISHMLRFAFFPKRVELGSDSTPEFSSEAEFFLHPNLERLKERIFDHQFRVPGPLRFLPFLSPVNYSVDLHLTTSVIHENTSTSSLVLGYPPGFARLYPKLTIELLEVYCKNRDPNSRKSHLVFAKTLPTENRLVPRRSGRLEFVFRLPIDLNQRYSLHTVRVN